MKKTSKVMVSIFLIFFICGATSSQKLSYSLDSGIFGEFLRQYCLLRQQSKVLIYADMKSGWWSTELSSGWIYLVKYLISNDISITVIDLPSHGYHKLPIMAKPPGGFATLLTVMYDGSSTSVGAHLKRFSDLRLFRSRYNWLILTPMNKQNYLEELLQQLGIYTDSNIHFGVLHPSQAVKIWEVYHVALNKPLRIIHVGDWSPIDVEEPSTTVPRVTSNPETQIPPSRLWTLRAEKLPYKYVKRSNLEGIRLKAITVGMRQYITDFRRNSKGTLEVTGGFFGEVFKTIMDSINFTYSLAYIPGYSYGKIKELGNNWTGVVGYLASKRADIALCGISESKWRMPVIDLTAPLMFQRSRLFVNSSPSPYQIDLYFRPFTKNLWTFLITCFLLIAFFQKLSRLLYGIVKNKHLYSKQKNQKTGQKGENTLSRRKYSRNQIIDQDSSSEDSRSSTRLIILSGSILFTIASTGYSAKLTSIHAVHRFIPEVRNIDDLAKSPDWEMGILNGSWDRWLMKNAPRNSSMGILWKNKIQRNPSSLLKYPIEGLLKVSQNQKYAFLGESLESLLILAGIKVGAIEDNLEKDKGEEFKLEANLQGEEMLPRDAACKIAELPGDVLKIGSSFGLQKYSPIKDIFNYHLIKLWSTGILQNVKKRFIEPQRTICDGKSVFLPASIGDTFFSVILFGIGVTLSLVILTMELALMKIKKEKRVLRKKRKSKKMIPYHD